jgi:hypothetical protein
MRKLVTLLASCWILASVLAAQAPEELSGTWSSPNVKFIISKSPGHGWKVQASDDCLPRWCDWGEVPLSLIVTSADGQRPAPAAAKTYTHAFAVWSVGPYSKNVVFNFDPAGVQAEIFTVYDPNTGRTDYRYVARLTRSK